MTCAGGSLVPFVFEEACYVAQHQKQSSCAAVNEADMFSGT